MTRELVHNMAGTQALWWLSHCTLDQPGSTVHPASTYSLPPMAVLAALLPVVLVCWPLTLRFQ